MLTNNVRECVSIWRRMTNAQGLNGWVGCMLLAAVPSKRLRQRLLRIKMANSINSVTSVTPTNEALKKYTNGVNA